MFSSYRLRCRVRELLDLLNSPRCKLRNHSFSSSLLCTTVPRLIAAPLLLFAPSSQCAPSTDSPYNVLPFLLFSFQSFLLSVAFLLQSTTIAYDNDFFRKDSRPACTPCRSFLQQLPGRRKLKSPVTTPATRSRSIDCVPGA